MNLYKSYANILFSKITFSLISGIWPSISVVHNTANDFFSNLNSIVRNVKHYRSIQSYLQIIHNNRENLRFVVVYGSISVDHLPTLIAHSYKVYIKCSDIYNNEYNAWSERYPKIISVLQCIDTLTRLILWDFSICIIYIGDNYRKQNREDFAQNRYRFASRLHIVIQQGLNERMGMFHNARQQNSTY